MEGIFNIRTTKKNRDQNDIKNFRPIGLSSCIVKTLETMIKSRLDWKIEKGNILSRYQTGFRKGKGMFDDIVYLTSFVQISLAKGKKIIGILLDIQQHMIM